jgi:hypothetical protein
MKLEAALVQRVGCYEPTHPATMIATRGVPPMRQHSTEQLG